MEKIQPGGDNIALNDFLFAKTGGVNMRMGPNAMCSDFFVLYFTKEFWELLLTNRFAIQFFENDALTCYTSEWVPVTIGQMKVFKNSWKKCTKAESDKRLQHTHGRCGLRGSTSMGFIP